MSKKKVWIVWCFDPCGRGWEVMFIASSVEEATEQGLERYGKTNSIWGVNSYDLDSREFPNPPLLE